jgi:gamma-glutamylcyclotransferase (GGCT)/AIG2-like uncharacterized protein YtfP
MPLYFAYGSNLSTSQMTRRCPTCKTLKIGCLEGYRLAFNYYSSGWNGGVADIVVDAESEVWGLIYELSKEDLQCLDNCEGYPDVYTRFQTSIKTRSGTISNVWVYTVVQKKNFVPPTKAYIEIIKSAALRFQFPETYLSYLETVETSA